jgi:hypothetical protein
MVVIQRNVRYFEKPGKQNTQAIIEVVRTYLEEGNEAAALIIASISGQTALNVKKEIVGISIPVVCVTGSPSWQMYSEYEFPLVPEPFSVRTPKSVSRLRKSWRCQETRSSTQPSHSGNGISKR